MDLSVDETESLDKLSAFTLEGVDWTKGLEAWNKVFVSHSFHNVMPFAHHVIF